MKIIKVSQLLVLGIIWGKGEALHAQMVQIPSKRPQPHIVWDDGRPVLIEKHGFEFIVFEPKKKCNYSINNQKNSFPGFWDNGYVYCVSVEADRFYLNKRKISSAWERMEIQHE